MNFADKTIFTKDNIDILRGLNSECVDLIYLDPPFNSNKNYIVPLQPDQRRPIAGVPLDASERGRDPTRVLMIAVR